jgi:hypothetical protein
MLRPARRIGMSLIRSPMAAIRSSGIRRGQPLDHGTLVHRRMRDIDQSGPVRAANTCVLNA